MSESLPCILPATPTHLPRSICVEPSQRPCPSSLLSTCDDCQLLIQGDGTEGKG